MEKEEKSFENRELKGRNFEERRRDKKIKVVVAIRSRRGRGKGKETIHKLGEVKEALWEWIMELGVLRGRRERENMEGRKGIGVKKGNEGMSFSWDRTYEACYWGLAGEGKLVWPE